MRILFTFSGGNGHFIPLVPFARESQLAGHTVAFGCGRSMVATVERAGLKVIPLGAGSAQPPQKSPLRPLDAAREDQEFRDRFVREGARHRAPHTRALCIEWQPDVLVCDETDFGSMVAAESLGLPHVTVLVMAAGSFVRAEVIGDALNELRAKFDLPPERDLALLYRHLVLSPFPPSFRDPAFPLPPTAYSFRPMMNEREASDTPSWLSRLRDAPTIYFTLGTVFNMESGDLFTRVLDGLRALHVNVVVTVGEQIDPAEFGPLPANVFIERYLAQATILPHSSLVISHGGSGSVMGALAFGLPSVLIPMGADQPLNAARAVQLGVAEMLDPMQVTAEIVCDTVTRVLSEQSYRRAAERLRDEFLALPAPARAVPLLEQLALKIEQ